jgi:hypothetical protein
MLKLGVVACAGFEKGVWVFTLFQGYDWVTVLVVANLAFSGLLVSWVMKFADSILKVRIILHALGVLPIGASMQGRMWRDIQGAFMHGAGVCHLDGDACYCSGFRHIL